MWFRWIIRVDYLLFSPKMISVFLYWAVVRDDLACDVWLTPSKGCNERRCLSSWEGRRHFALVPSPPVQIMWGLYRQVGVTGKDTKVFCKDLLGHFHKVKVSSPCSFTTQTHELSKVMSVTYNTIYFPLFLANMCPNTRELICSLYQ